MEALKNANLALRFLLELGALAAVAYWGLTRDLGVVRWVLALAAAAAVVLVWFLFVAPEPAVALARPLRLVIELGVWAAAGAALWTAGHPRLGVVFFVVAAVSGVVNYVWD